MNKENNLLSEQLKTNVLAQVLSQRAPSSYTKLEFDRIRNRFVGDLALANAQEYLIESFVGKILPILDNLESALQTNTEEDCHMKVALDLISKQLVQAFHGLGVAEMCPHVGDRFDPSRHRQARRLAVNPQNYFINKVHKKGFFIRGHLLRPALVTVNIE